MFDIYLFCVHNEKSWDVYEWGGKSHKYDQGKTLIMIANKVMVLTY
jgi:hypothetical protein